ncbi:DUF4402 domain-containing protein [Altererythrobacter sp.]|nr:DUF4402 domain-containing protein [Altererythrobacter sp.]
MKKPGLSEASYALGRAAIGLAALTLALCAPASALAQDNEAASQAAGSIIANGTMRKTADMDFGKLAPGDSGGTIVLAPDGATSTTGSVASLSTATPATFRIARRTGLDFPAYVSPTTADSITLSHASVPSATMELTNFTNDFNRTRTIFFGLFTVPGWFGLTEYDFRVGGTLNVASDQLPGVYAGEFVVRVDFE